MSGQHVPYDIPRTVPDGAWVAETGLGHFCTIGGEMIELIQLDRHSQYRRFLMLGTEPFSVISWKHPDGGRRLRPARQVEKGKLVYPNLPAGEPSYAREAPMHPCPTAPPRDQRRSRTGWGRVSDVAAWLDISVEQLLLHYWDYLDYRYDPSMWTQPVRMELLFAQRREDIHMQQVQRRRRLHFTQREIVERIDARTDWNALWIRRGFARTIGYLQLFDYQSEAVSSSQLQPA